jgi:hypothetical protein
MFGGGRGGAAPYSQALIASVGRCMTPNPDLTLLRSKSSQFTFESSWMSHGAILHINSSFFSLLFDYCLVPRSTIGDLGRGAYTQVSY